MDRGTGCSGLDFTRRARAGTLSRRVKEVTHGVAAVGALPMGFWVKLGLVRICLLGYRRWRRLLFLLLPSEHCVLPLSCLFGPVKMPLANSQVVLNLLDGLVGVDPTFHVI